MIDLAEMRCSLQMCIHLKPELPCSCDRNSKDNKSANINANLFMSLLSRFCGMFSFTIGLTHLDQIAN